MWRSGYRKGQVMAISSGVRTLGNNMSTAVDRHVWPRPPGVCTLTLESGNGTRREYRLDRYAGIISIGRSDAADIAVSEDSTVSRLHAVIEQICDCWVVVDDGMSTNGTFVNGERIGGRHTLESGDTLKVGQTVFTFSEGTHLLGEEVPTTPVLRVSRNSLTDAQYLVLEALCGSCGSEIAHCYPASNCRIAQDLCLSIATVKTHLRALYRTFQVDDFPQNQKRVVLVERALASGVLTDRKPGVAG
ncbi:FHA domain-containing protein [Nocardia sp. NPDC057663]|uniref:FHA domain-containing protein n=1 Tax=Nocardia sp. NPDC057663 TaxID=3346201 RepID=UPI0036734284